MRKTILLFISFFVFTLPALAGYNMRRIPMEIFIVEPYALSSSEHSEVIEDLQAQYKQVGAYFDIKYITITDPAPHLNFILLTEDYFRALIKEAKRLGYGGHGKMRLFAIPPTRDFIGQEYSLGLAYQKCYKTTETWGMATARSKNKLTGESRIWQTKVGYKHEGGHQCRMHHVSGTTLMNTRALGFSPQVLTFDSGNVRNCRRCMTSRR